MAYARVARWEGGEADSIRKAAEEIQRRAESGPPEGVPSTGITMLIDPDGGQVLSVGLFETEEDYRKGDETLNSMSPPDDGFGTRVDVKKFEVMLDLRA